MTTSAALGVLSSLIVFISQLRLPLVAAKVDILRLGGLFDNESYMSTLTALGERQCLPQNFSPGQEMLAAVQCSQRKACHGENNEEDAVYDCLAEISGLIVNNKIQENLFTTIMSHTTDTKWVDANRIVGDICVSTINDDLTSGQKAVYLFTCLQWNMELACDLQETDEPPSGGASCRRAAFLAGRCPLSPRVLLERLPGVAADRTWEECAADLDVPDHTFTETQCRQLDTAAVQLVSCRLKQYVGANDRLDVDRLRADVAASQGDAEVKETMLEMVETCGLDSNSVVEELVYCWIIQGLMTCATSEAAQRAGKYRTC